MGVRAMSCKEERFAKRAPGSGGGLPRHLWMTAALLLPLFGASWPAAASLVWQGLAAALGVAGGAAAWAATHPRRWDGFAANFPGQGGGLAAPGHRHRVPLVTPAFIMTSVLLSLVLPGTAIDRLCGLRFDDPGLGDLIRVAGAHALLHDTHGPLIINAALLGLPGAYLEYRLGALRTLGVLLMGSIVAALIGLNLLLPQVALADAGPHLLRYPPAGGAGAAAALLGFGAAAGRSQAMDILWPLLTALLFWGVFSGYTMPATGLSGMAGYWGLVGGFLSGLMLALIWRIPEENDMRGETRPGDASALPALTGAGRNSAWPCRERLAADRA